MDPKPGFFEAAYRGKNDLWRYLVVALLVIVGYILGQMPFGVAALLKTGSGEEIDLTSFRETADFSYLGLEPNMGLFLLLLSFVGALIFLCVGVNWIHRRPWQSLVSYYGRFKVGKIAFGFFIWLFLWLCVEAISYLFNPELYEFYFSGSQFFILLLIALLVLPLQTSFEEFFFRGWMMQGLGVYSGKKWIALVFSTLAFAAIHSLNPEVKEYGYLPMMFYYLQAGLLLGLITILDDSLDLALGIHFATNFYAAVFFNYEAAALQTHSLFSIAEPLNVATVNLVFFVLALVLILICKIKYNWKLDDVFSPIAPPGKEGEELMA